MDGMPDNVSVVIPMIETSLFPFPAYSVRYTAAPIPTGTANSRERSVISNVFISAGSKDTFSDVYLAANNSGVRLGIPFISIYPIIKNNPSIVKNAARHTERNKRNDFGSRLYVHHLYF